jgi:WD40 repeat protein
MAAQSQGQVGTMTFDCGTLIRENICKRSTGIRVRSIALLFRPNGRTLASGSRDGTVLLWQLSSSTAFGVEPLARGTTTLGNIKRTALLQNYPNPFNPETWMPYQLANDALVTLTIYDQSGHIVRTLDTGRQISGVYRDKASAAYWDGRNQNGEPVTSGTYYYQLRAEDYTALRRMVIVK